jgi:hypothetical protein
MEEVLWEWLYDDRPELRFRSYTRGKFVVLFKSGRETIHVPGGVLCLLMRPNDQIVSIKNAITGAPVDKRVCSKDEATMRIRGAMFPDNWRELEPPLFDPSNL